MEKIIHNLNNAHKKHSKDNPIIILIDGRGGSGKTTFAKKLSDSLENSFLISLDEYTIEYTDLFDDSNVKNNFNIDFSEISYNEDEILKQLEPKTFCYIIIEGCFSFNNIIKIKPDYRIGVEQPQEICLQRLNNREMNDPSRSHIAPELILLANRQWQKSESKYIESFKPIALADFVIED